ncbi:MAG: glycine cleavage system protein GcvH [Desulfarculaceae bacterium]|nr:glycine cleavage system protein GcvH [Desulfarculaceae bacterium]
MKELQDLNLPEELKYSKDHEWAKKENGNIRMGIDDYAQDQLGEIVFVEMPEVGDTFSQGDEVGSLESVKAVSEFYAPLSGEVVKINEELEDSPELVNQSCYDNGWIVEIKPDDVSELENLMDKKAYYDMLKG